MQQAVLQGRQETERIHTLQVVLNNQQVYHTSKTTIDLDVNTYLTIDPKVRTLTLFGIAVAHTSTHVPISILCNSPSDRLHTEVPPYLPEDSCCMIVRF